MVLRRSQGSDALAVADHQKRKLLAFETFFQHHRRAGGAENFAAQHFGGDHSGFLAGLGNDHALAGGQAVGFDDDGRMEKAERVLHFLRLVAHGEMRGRNVVALHEQLGEALARFQARGGLGWSEDAQTAAGEFIHHAESQRQFGADDGEIGMKAIGEFDDGVEILDVQRQALGFLRDAAVAGRAAHFADARRLHQLPDEGVLASAATQHQNFAGHSETYRVENLAASCKLRRCGDVEPPAEIPNGGEGPLLICAPLTLRAGLRQSGNDLWRA